MIYIPRLISHVPLVRGVARLALSAYSRLFKGRYSIERREGMILLLDRENAIDWQLILSGRWEEPHTRALFRLAREQRPYCGNGAIFLDIGAHWGLYALKARETGLFGRIAAFEPDPTNFAQLQANLFLNRAESSIEAFRLAATDRERVFGLYQRTAHNRGATRVVESDASDRAVVRGRRIDSLFDVSDALMVVKIDVESHELEAVAGIEKLLPRNRFVIQIEIWDTPKEESERRIKHLSELFGTHGIRLVHAIDHDYFFASEIGVRAAPRSA
jgi:FkbM family methyltransferase